MLEKNLVVLMNTPISFEEDARRIWDVAKLARGIYQEQEYGNIIIPMMMIRRLECALTKTKPAVIAKYKENPFYPTKAMYRISGQYFYNTSEYDLKKICDDPDNIVENFINYIDGFSETVQLILNEFDLKNNIKKMDKGGCLYGVLKAFAEVDLSPETYDSVKIGYVFENILARFFQNVNAGQFFTARDTVMLGVSILTSEGSDDIFAPNKVITICDQACGTGGMLSSGFSYIKLLNPSANIQLFGQELMGISYAAGLAEMLIKGQNVDNFRHVDTLKTDCFPDTKMRYVLENPPFGVPWAGKSAKTGQEDAVRAEHEKGIDGRWGAGLPAGDDAQLLFMQSAINKMDDTCGRAAIITNGSPLFSGNVKSGESQIRKWMIENDLIEAIIQLPTDSFYNTNISTYYWILSKNKRAERKGKIQLIDASKICHKLKKPLGKKRYEFTIEDIALITQLYANFKETDIVKIYDNTEFMYKEYTIKQPLQRNYSITDERIDNLINNKHISSFYDKEKHEELMTKEELTVKEKTSLAKYNNNEKSYYTIINALRKSINNDVYLSLNDFIPILNDILKDADIKKDLLLKIAHGLSVMDKNAEIHKETKGKNKGEIIYDEETKDTERLKWNEDIDEYMTREVLPHVPDAKWFWEENLDAKKPKIKTGAEISFNRCFYKYQQPTASEELEKTFVELETSISERIKKLFGGE